jgi:hypothetical protein
MNPSKSDVDMMMAFPEVFSFVSVNCVVPVDGSFGYGFA